MRYNYANIGAVNNEHVTSLVSILDLRPKGFELFFFKICSWMAGLGYLILSDRIYYMEFSAKKKAF